MSRRLIVFFAFTMLSTLPVAASQPIQSCKITFQVAYLDRLNNTSYGIPKSSQKDIQKRLEKLGDVRYAGDDKAGDLLLFIQTSPAIYHGSRVYRNTSNSSAAATDGNGNAAAAAAATTTTTAVPYSVDYSVFILDVELPTSDNNYKILHTVDQKGLYNTIYGIGYGKGKHPIPNAIEAAARWIHDDYIGGGSRTKW